VLPRLKICTMPVRTPDSLTMRSTASVRSCISPELCRPKRLLSGVNCQMGLAQHKRYLSVYSPALIKARCSRIGRTGLPIKSMGL
jgi:hypothetical protein